MFEKPVVHICKINDNSSFPWRFSITFKGETFRFLGIPNHCSSRRSAAIRAWWRCRWLMDGTYSKKYVTS
jgi:hypothetical protein